MSLHTLKRFPDFVFMDARSENPKAGSCELNENYGSFLAE